MPEIDVFVNQIKVNINLGCYKLWPGRIMSRRQSRSNHFRKYAPLQSVNTKTLLPEWMDVQARDDDHRSEDGYIVSFDYIIEDEHVVSNQSIIITPTWSRSQNLILNGIMFDNIKIDANEGILTVCDITTYKCGDHVQEGNILNDPDSSLKVEFKTPLYDWLLDSIL